MGVEGTPQHTEPVFYMVCHNAKLVDDGKRGHKAVRFTLSLCVDDDALFSFPGWRVRRGSVVPPSRQDSSGNWWPMAELPTDRGKRALAVLVSAWASLYPDVEFPKIDEEKSNDDPN